MKHHVHTLALVLAVLVTCGSGCADLKEGLPQPVSPGVQVHRPGWTDTASRDFHGMAIRAANWDMSSCRTCHGATYAGGSAAGSCLKCHKSGAGPENCATCHGSAANPAPPRDMSKNTAATFRGVGAHQIHLTGSSIATLRPCSDCHVVPATLAAAGHIDDAPGSEVVMNTSLTRTVTNTGTTFPLLPGGPITPNPTYNTATLSCASTYCHGNFKNGNPSFAPVWNNTAGSQMACGTCHGDVNATTTYRKALPKTVAQGGTHPDPTGITTCATATACHVGVIDANFRILDPTKHINGKLNLGGVEFDF